MPAIRPSSGAARGAASAEAASQQQAAQDDGDDGDDLQEHQRALHIAAGADAEAVDRGQQRQHAGGHGAVGDGQMGELLEVAGKGDRHRRHPARLDHQQQRPAVEEGRHRPPGVAQIGILAADLGPPRGELGIDERAHDRDRAADQPDPDDQRWRGDMPRHLRRIDEDAGADDPAHDQHGRVEQAEPPDELRPAPGAAALTAPARPS